MTNDGKKLAARSEPEPAKARSHGAGRRWKPGQSGNPGGLSAERRAFLTAVRKEEEPHTRLVLAKLREIALTGVEWAVTDYLDRLGVKMPEKLELSGEDGAPLPVAVANPLDPSTMRSSEIRRRLVALRAERESLIASTTAVTGGATNGKATHGDGSGGAE